MRHLLTLRVSAHRQNRAALLVAALLAASASLAACSSSSSSSAPSTTAPTVTSSAPGSPTSSSSGGTPSAEWASLPSLQALTAQIAAATSISSIPSAHLAEGKEGPSQADLNGQIGCGTDANLSSETPCTFGDRAATRTLVVLGDSEADMWVPTFNTWGANEGWKVVRLVKYGCESWTDALPPQVAGWTECKRWRAFAIKTINALHPQAVVATGMEQVNQSGPISISASTIAKGIDGLRSALVPSKAKFLVLGNIPWFFNLNQTPSACVYTHSSNLTACDQPRATAVDPTMALAVAAAAASKGVTVVPVTSLFCSEKICPIVVGSTILYSDDHHMSSEWATTIPKALSEIIDPLLR